MRPRLLIIAYVFPPSESVGARRPGELARFAADQQWDVRVLTATPADSDAPDAGIPEGRIVRAAPVPRSAQLVSSVRRAEARSRVGRRRLLTALGAIGREVLIPDACVNWVVPAVRQFLRTRDGWRPDVIMVTGPPASAYLVAARLARRLNVPWVADYRDLWTVGNDYWPYGRTPVRRAIDHRLERRLLRSASSCVTISEPLAEIMRSTFGIDTKVVMNGIDRQPAVTAEEPTSPPAPAAPASSTLTLTHTGRLNPGKRDPSPLLDAVALLGPDARRVNIVFAGEDNGVAQAATERAGVADSVTNLGEVSAEKSWRVQAEADVLVLVMWNDPRDAGTMPGKFFDYLRARRPILMLGHPNGIVADIIRSRNAGAVLSDPHQIADQLRTWLAEKDRTGRIAELPASTMDGLYREDQLARYLEILTDAAATRGR
ncbi:glycosyltransferase [Micromonospora thermarum]|uniref:Glycosyltransferase family 4 protein n=1 Tax=Micromonospora thermarum TaxID=2720024 RepID=A0ABX0Z8L0_9ACTN|nr:glycosyltransferase [Micromonospora thermarum]NJP32596.1 glycosyltransferase family 4 protein [Micromonospora thermarum]